MMKLKVKFLDKNVRFHKGTEGAACYDVYASHIIANDEGSKAEVKLGFATAIPKGYKAVVVPRSSFTNKGWVMANSPAQIDSDYRGEWMLRFQAIPSGVFELHAYDTPKLQYPEFPFNIGDRVAQVYFEKVQPVEIYEVEELDETERGTGGFGSTGK